MFRHASPMPENVFGNGRKTRAQVNHMVGNCWCGAPHRHNRVSNEVQPLTQRHIMKTNGRHSSRTLTRGRRHNNHTRTWRKIRIDSSQNWCRTWTTVRCADPADTYDTTQILRVVSIGQFHVPLSPRRSGAKHIRTFQKKGNMQHDHKNTKLASTLENTSNKPQSATSACDANSKNHGTKTNCLGQYGASYVLGHNVTHRALWTHDGQMSAHNGPRITTRTEFTTCATRKRPTRE